MVFTLKTLVVIPLMRFALNNAAKKLIAIVTFIHYNFFHVSPLFINITPKVVNSNLRRVSVPT